MTLRRLRKITLPEQIERNAALWLGEIAEKLNDPACDRNEFCRETLAELYFPGMGGYDALLERSRESLAGSLSVHSLDPRNITLEPEYYAEVDAEKFARVKPLIWLWQSFDRSPAGGNNVDLAVRFRRLLAGHIFQRCGKNFKAFQFVEVSFGYNMVVGDDVVVHRHVLLDDRGGIELHDNVSIADYSNIYSHTHDIVEQAEVTNAVTVLEEGVRLTYHATVLAGVRVGKNAILGSLGVTSRDLAPHWVHLGIPARPKILKPNAPHEVIDA